MFVKQPITLVYGDGIGDLMFVVSDPDARRSCELRGQAYSPSLAVDVSELRMGADGGSRVR
jgi:hypothetical protein